MGSRVIRGNLHVIPIDGSILYVSPLYLRAETGQIPELKRVIAAYGDQIVMEENLADRGDSALIRATAYWWRSSFSTASDLGLSGERRNSFICLKLPVHVGSQF